MCQTSKDKKTLVQTESLNEWYMTRCPEYLIQTIGFQVIELKAYHELSEIFRILIYSLNENILIQDLVPATVQDTKDEGL